MQKPPLLSWNKERSGKVWQQQGLRFLKVGIVKAWLPNAQQHVKHFKGTETPWDRRVQPSWDLRQIYLAEEQWFKHAFRKSWDREQNLGALQDTFLLKSPQGQETESELAAKLWVCCKKVPHVSKSAPEVRGAGFKETTC